MQLTRRQNIALFAVRVMEQGDVRRPVGIVFDRRNFCRNVIFISLEVDDSVFLLDAAALMTGRDAAGVATAALALFR